MSEISVMILRDGAYRVERPGGDVTGMPRHGDGRRKENGPAIVACLPEPTTGYYRRIAKLFAAAKRNNQPKGLSTTRRTAAMSNSVGSSLTMRNVREP
jgi:hypothetical protein